MLRKIAYLVNPVSGGVKKDGAISLVKAVTAEKNIPYEIIPTHPSGHYDFLAEKIVTENITDIVIMGGDGTVNQIVAALRHSEVNFGIIPLGSGNGLALAANIPQKIEDAVNLLFSGVPQYSDAFYINQNFSCIISGVGFDAQVAKDFSTRAKRGLLTYIQQSVINYFKAQPYPFEVTVEGISFLTDAFFISVANGDQYGNHFTIAPQAKLNDGILDIVIAQKMNKVRLFFTLLQQISGKNKLQPLSEAITCNNILYFQAPRLKIKNLGHAPLHIDGEPAMSSTEFEISVIKNCFKLIQPPTVGEDPPVWSETTCR